MSIEEVQHSCLSCVSFHWHIFLVFYAKCMSGLTSFSLKELFSGADGGVVSGIERLCSAVTAATGESRILLK